MDKTKFASLGICATAALHMVCCGVPIAAAVLGIASPFAGLLPHGLRIVLLVFGAFAVGVSWFFYFTGCKCNKKLLIFSTVLFALALALAFIPHAHGPDCH
ncbi:MAG: hypothetical protein FWE17_01440 [Alphaproteobacteria bacterium]|nr:hypothetical protein [Alphaproteobacteria bacterium]MCL2757946.1 hypothetical protein [Alphaproteobacteria bacterium]